MYKGILLFCIFCNFFSPLMLKALGIENDNYIMRFIPSFYSSQANVELIIIFVCLVIASFVVKEPIKTRQNVANTIYKFKKGGYFELGIKVFYFVSIAFMLVSSNWGGSTENRGIGQFELENRQTFIQGVISGFYLPFMLYLYIIKVFKNTNWFVAGGILIYMLHGILSGGRSEVVLSTLIFLLYFYYIRGLSKKKMVCFLGITLIALMFSANDRFNTSDSVLTNLLVKIVQCNSSSYFLPAVQYAVNQGIELSPGIFGMHFVSIFIPSYVYVTVFNVISYTRSTFVFNDLYNTTTDNGLGFMMLADFFWCFSYYGYILYIIAYYFVIRFFSKNIYSIKPVKVIMAIMAVELFCNQRADFGAFIKPFVYTFIFLSILEFLRNYELRQKRRIR